MFDPQQQGGAPGPRRGPSRAPRPEATAREKQWVYDPSNKQRVSSPPPAPVLPSSAQVPAAPAPAPPPDDEMDPEPTRVFDPSRMRASQPPAPATPPAQQSQWVYDPAEQPGQPVPPPRAPAAPSGRPPAPQGPPPAIPGPPAPPAPGQDFDPYDLDAAPAPPAAKKGIPKIAIILPVAIVCFALVAGTLVLMIVLERRGVIGGKDEGGEVVASLDERARDEKDDESAGSDPPEESRGAEQADPGTEDESGADPPSSETPTAAPDPSVEETEADTETQESPPAGEEPDEPSPAKKQKKKAVKSTKKHSSAPKNNYPDDLGKKSAPEPPPADLPEQPSKEALKAALKKVEPAVNKCGGGEKGMAMVALTVKGSSGKVSSAKVTSGPFKSGPASSCIVKAVKKARFPKFSKSSLSFSYPFVIR